MGIDEANGDDEVNYYDKNKESSPRNWVNPVQ